MCRDCYSDPAWDEIHYRRQGAVDVDDFYKEVNYQTRMKGRGWSRGGSHKQNGKPRKRGCPANNNKAHVYVWTTENNIEDLFFRFYGFHKWEKEFCCGCDNRRGRRLTERYLNIKDRKYKKLTNGAEFNVKRGEPVAQSWRFRRNIIPSYSMFEWETNDEEYMEYRKDYIKKNGYNSYVHGNRYSWI